jgi:ATP-dependent exoDNAse (exonuclease V) alpha subunit
MRAFAKNYAPGEMIQPERDYPRLGLERGVLYDRVRITRNDAALDLANGDRFTVAEVAKEAITLHDGRREVLLPADRPLHVDHAYATTVHSSQGTTAERVLIDAATKSRTTAKDVYYVAISRARQEARTYTDDKAKLPLAVAREHTKHPAMELER